ncbi:MAG: hypothetical protein R3Y46_02705 [Opitutales bacterium]
MTSSLSLSFRYLLRAGGLPSLTPSAFLRAKASFVRCEWQCHFHRRVKALTQIRIAHIAIPDKKDALFLPKGQRRRLELLS